MTRQEAIKILQDKAYLLYEDTSPRERQAFDMAIRSLEAWEKIIADLEEVSTINDPCLEFGLSYALHMIKATQEDKTPMQAIWEYYEGKKQ